MVNVKEEGLARAGGALVLWLWLAPSGFELSLQAHSRQIMMSMALAYIHLSLVIDLVSQAHHGNIVIFGVALKARARVYRYGVLYLLE